MGLLPSGHSRDLSVTRDCLKKTQVTVVTLKHNGPTKRLDEMNPNPQQAVEDRMPIEKLDFPDKRYRLVQRFAGLFR